MLLAATRRGLVSSVTYSGPFIVIVAIAKMVELHLFPRLWATDKRDFAVFTATFAVVIFVDAATGLAVGVAAQWLMALTRTVREPSKVRLFAWRRGLFRDDESGVAYTEFSVVELQAEDGYASAQRNASAAATSLPLEAGARRLVSDAGRSAFSRPAARSGELEASACVHLEQVVFGDAMVAAPRSRGATSVGASARQTITPISFSADFTASARRWPRASPRPAAGCCASSSSATPAPARYATVTHPRWDNPTSSR